MTTDNGSSRAVPSERAVPADVRETAPLPGVGVIRARALKKAGFGTLEALKAATLEQLQAVPGITPAKAAQIFAYLHAEPDSEPAEEQQVVSRPNAASPAPAEGVRKPDPRAADGRDAKPQPSPISEKSVREVPEQPQKAPSTPPKVRESVTPSAIRARLTEIAVLAEDILRGPLGKKLDKSLEKQLARWIALSESAKAPRGPGVERHLNAVETALRDALEMDRMSGKAQDRLAALLRAERKAMAG